MNTISKVELYELAEWFTNRLNKQFEVCYSAAIKEFNSYDNKSELKKYVKEEILSTNLQSKIFLILAKCNCVCDGNKDIYCYADKCRHSIPITTSSNFNESIAYHNYRAYLSEKKRKGKKYKVFFVKEQKTPKHYHFNDQIENSVHFQSIFKGGKKFDETLLFDKPTIVGISKMMNDALKADPLDCIMYSKIRESIIQRVILDARISAFCQFVSSSKSFYKPINAELQSVIELKVSDFIETTFGAGLFYLFNTQFTGFVSYGAIKEYLKKGDAYNFTDDHIYARKLASKFLLNKERLTYKELRSFYINQFSYVTFLTSSENLKIKNKKNDTGKMALPLPTYLKYYKKGLSKEGIYIIKTTIKSKNALKSILKYLHKNGLLNERSTIDEVQDLLTKYTNFARLWIA